MKKLDLKLFFAFVWLVMFNAPLNAQTVPSDIMRNCKQWKITYPTGVEDKTLCGEANNEFYFLTSTKDAIAFNVPIRSDNGSTPNSSYIRSELRERTEDGTADIYWTTTGRHVLYVKQAITHLPLVKPHLVGTQIHGNKADGIDDSMVLRLESDHLFLSFNGGKLRSDVTIKTGYVLGTKHEVIFEVLNGKHYCYYSEDGNLLNAYQNGTASQYYVKVDGSEMLMDLNYDQTYFKVGNYTQSNPEKEGDKTDDPNNYGEVLVYDFLVEHGDKIPDTGTEVKVTGVTLSPSTITMATGTTSQLTATVNPSNATNNVVSYSSSNTAVATVSATGVVTAKSKGTATITVTTADGGHKATTSITVNEIPQGLTNIALNKAVTATVTPDAPTPADYLVDGSTNTRMSSSGYPQTLTIDLGASFTMSYSELVFYQDRAYQYTIAVANSVSGPYTTVVDRSNNTTTGTAAAPLTDYFTASGRYVQLTVTGAANYTGTWVSIQEFKVFGKADLVTASTPKVSNTQIALFPMPASQYLNYQLENANDIHKATIYDVSGKLIRTEAITNETGSIDVSELKTGAYILQFEGETSIHKLFNKQ